MPITPLNGDLTAGIAGHYTETINPSADPLVTGDVPALLVTDEVVLADQTLAALTVVGFDGADKLVPANNTTVAAIGILVYAVDTTGADAVAHVYRMGCFNPELLVWDAAYSTDALKKVAFEGAPSPSAIIVRKPTAMTV